MLIHTRAGSLARQAIVPMRRLSVAVFAAAAFITATAPHADAFWITQPGGESVNGSGVTGCVDVNGGSSAQHTPVGFYPCNGLPLEQWTYKNGQIIGIGGNCLTANSSEAAEMDTCNGSSLAQQWVIRGGPTGLSINNELGGCLQSSGKAGGGEQLTLAGNCNPSTGLWSLTAGFWIAQPSGATVNGAGITGCAIVGNASQVGDAVAVFPCFPSEFTEWSYTNGEIRAADGLCVEPSQGTIVEDTCTGKLNQMWEIFPGNPGGNGNVNWIESEGSSSDNCIVSSGIGILALGSCSGADAAWSLTN